ncbi:MAG TPA: hypothetical protein H9675_01575 [Firmicutes bacterium]|nr:hypothetical protein [Bacillota bacterium]
MALKSKVEEKKQDKGKLAVKILFALGIIYNVYKTCKIVKNGLAIIKDM